MFGTMEYRTLAVKIGIILNVSHVNMKLSLSTPLSHSENRAIAAHILHLGTKWMGVVNFTLRPLYNRERTPGLIE
jgi:hypothetical protein